MSPSARWKRSWGINGGSRFLVLDIGTSSLKCGVVSASGVVEHSSLAEFEHRRTGPIFEVDFDSCAGTALDLIAGVTRDAGRASEDIDAILITSQAQTFVPVDRDFRPLRAGIVWLDSRAVDEAKLLARELPDFDRTAGFTAPMAELYISKILWLRNNEPDIFKRAAAFPLINEFIAWKLTGRHFSGHTSFGMGGLLDIREGIINARALSVLGLDRDMLPELAPAARLSYPLNAAAAARLDLPAGIRVYFCGNDQCASAAGAGAATERDVSANFGTAMVVYAHVDDLPQAIAPHQIAGVDPLTSRYFLLSCEPEAGTVVDTVRSQHFPGIGYDDLFAKYAGIRSQGLIEDIRIENGRVVCAARDPDIIAASLIGHLAKRFSGFLSEIRKFSPVETIHASGGMAASDVWLDIVRDAAQCRVTRATAREAGLSGAVVIFNAAARGAHEQ